MAENNMMDKEKYLDEIEETASVRSASSPAAVTLRG